MRAVISGGAGFLGSHLCDYLLERDWEVLAIDNLVTGSEANIRLYQRRGYAIARTEKVSPSLSLVFLEKRAR